MLHIVNKSPTERSNLASCLAHALPGHSVLLIEDDDRIRLSLAMALEDEGYTAHAVATAEEGQRPSFLGAGYFIRYLVLGGIVLIVVIGLAVGVFVLLGALPGHVARKRGHPWAEAVAIGGWKHVILQQGPSSLETSRANLRDYALRFAAEVRKVGAEPAMYQVWPPTTRPQGWAATIESFIA